jgi:hypothetical protein
MTLTIGPGFERSAESAIRCCSAGITARACSLLVVRETELSRVLRADGRVVLEDAGSAGRQHRRLAPKHAGYLFELKIGSAAGQRSGSAGASNIETGA